MDVPYIDHLLDVFHNQLGPEKSKWVLDQFDGKKSIEEMITFLWDLEDAHLSLTPTLVPSEKSDPKADKLRVEGDNCYTQNNFDKALELYNLSILAARHPALPQEHAHDKINNNDSNMMMNEYKALALGYACRSAVLLDLEEYEQSLCDIERAFTYGCPESAQMKLEDRRTTCLAAQKNKVTVVNGHHHSEYDIDFNDACCMMQKCGEVPSEEITSKEILHSSQDSRQLPKDMESHPNIPALSSALKLAYTPTKGRHLMAERDINPGEVVGIEKSYCNGLYCEDFSTHCNTCLMECLTPLPCPNCSMVIFCSEGCRDKGLSESHWQECSLLPTLVALEKRENTVTYIAFRLILHQSYMDLRDELPVLQEEAKKHDPTRLGFDSAGLYSSTDYRPVYHLVGNKNQRPSKELYETCVIAFILTKLLIKGEQYFKDSLGQPIAPAREDFLMIGQLFVHHILNIYCNAFQLSNMKLTATPIKIMLRVFGEGVFPGLSLFNHSCNPTVRYYNHGDRLVMRAVTFIPAGEEVTTTYCGSFYMEDLETRREYLMNSYINCTCEACLDKWSVTRGLPRAMQVKCTSCGSSVSHIGQSPTCPSCKLNYGQSHTDENKTLLVDKWWAVTKSLKQAETKVQFILLRKKAGQPALPEDIQILSSFIENAVKHVKLPCQSFCYAMDTLFLIFCLQFCSSANT